jgi:hypothetical protein
VLADYQGIMDRMARMSPRASAVAASVATVLVAIAGAAALPALRRGLRPLFKPAAEGTAEDEPIPEPAGAEPTPQAPEAPKPPARRSRMTAARKFPARAKAFAYQGCTTTFLVLLALGLGTGLYAKKIRPDSAIPRPGSPSVSVTFELRRSLTNQGGAVAAAH